MASIKAFKGLRYSKAAGDLKELCCPPYDIINEDERRALVNTNPFNIIRLEKPEQTPEGYKQAAATLSDWLEKGILADDEKENIYAYEFTFEDNGTARSVKGFVALVRLHNFDENIVLPHEETLSKAKTDRFSLMSETGCNFSQIYSLYQDESNMGLKILDFATSDVPPTSEFTDGDNVIHRLWAIDSPEVIAKLVKLLEDKKIYIADGHHRYETALAFCKEVINNSDRENLGSVGFVPMFLVNMENPGLTVWPTHRIVRDLPGYDYRAIIAKSMQYFDVAEYHSREECLKNLDKAGKEGKNAFVMYTGGGRCTLMTLKNKSVMDEIMADSDPSLRGLDVSVLHSLVLERLMGIDKENMAAQKNLTYTRVFAEAIEAVDSGKANCSFLLNSTPIEAIGNVAATGQKMPQKSTYFYPKLTTGLVMNRIFK